MALTFFRLTPGRPLGSVKPKASLLTALGLTQDGFEVKMATRLEGVKYRKHQFTPAAYTV